jgi:hypothetical protein
VRAPEDVPLWVPPPVRSTVAAWLRNPGYHGHLSDLAVLRRLATDPRMQTVWGALEGKPPAALRDFFAVALDAAVHRRRITTAKQLEAEAARVSRSADDVRWIDQSTAKKLDEAARAMRARSEKPGADPPVVIKDGGWRAPLIVVQRHEQNDATRAYVLELASVTRKLFGKTMRGTIATTAMVALQTAVTEQQVRNWTS